MYAPARHVHSIEIASRIHLEAQGRMSRLDQINRFYEILRDLEGRVGGKRYLADCHGKMTWPKRGVYFFFEPGEKRSSGIGLRTVRVGTHAVIRKSRRTLWHRLRTHRGTLRGKRAGGGNHRGSIFRLHVGTAILRKERMEERISEWSARSSVTSEVREREYNIEKKVSQHIRSMPFLWLKVDDAPGPQSQRAYLERNAIALLSNYGKLKTDEAIDQPSIDWLGHRCSSEKVCKSGLWNVNHVTEGGWKPSFLDILQRKVDEHARGLRQ